MIRVEGVCRNFGEITVLRNITTNFYRGKINFVIGESGSGKSVLLKCLLGLLSLDKGNVSYDGIVLNRLSTKKVTELRKKIGTVFQGNALFDSYSIEENIAFPLKMFSSDTRKDIRYKVDQALDRVNLPGVGSKYPGEISGGQKKRVAIARAIVTTPEYLFCDEPNSGLDPKNAIIIDKLIQGLTHEHNMTTVVITHDMNSLFEIGDAITLIKNQENKWQGTKEELFTTDQDDLIEFVYASEWFRKVRKIAQENQQKFRS